MFFYTNVLSRDGRIYFKGYKEDEHICGSRPYSPYVFTETNETTEFKAFYNNSINLEKKYFPDVEILKHFTTNYSGGLHGIGFSKSDVDRRAFAYQFISDTFASEIEYDRKKIKLITFDIETESDKRPQVENPEQAVLAITLYIHQGDSLRYITLGIHEYEDFKEVHPDKEYIYCPTESDLLEKFCDILGEEKADIYSGYNSNFFDWPYLISRIESKYTKSWLKKLSPFGLMPRRYMANDRFVQNKKNVTYEIYGVAMLDWLDLYRKFTFVTRDSYTLNNIASVELDEKKIDYSEYKSLHDLYKNNWKKFIDYNIKDVILLERLENKLKLIELAIRVAYVAKVNYEDVFSPVKVWDIMVYNYLISKGIVAPMMNHKTKDRINIGGRVKDPRIGFCQNLVTVDATSLYPTTMLSLNISPECFIGKLDINESMILDRSFDNTDIKKHNFSIAANGSMFDRSKIGVFVELIQKLFDERTSYKEMMFKLENEHGDENTIKMYNVFQEAIKILMNSLYGSLCNEYFRYFHIDIAEAITVTGQCIVQTAENSLNSYVNNVLGTHDVDYTVFSDTDSCGIELDGIIKKFNVPDDKVNEFLDKVAKQKFDPLLNDVFNEFADYLNFFQNKIYFKREMIVRKGFIVAKKKYAMSVLSKEKIIYEKPKLVVKGLEIVRSSTPELVRDYLKDIVRVILESTESETQKYIKGFKEKFIASSIEEISFPRGVNDISKYVVNNSFSSGCPIHIRGSLVYNQLLLKLDLADKYEPIKEGDKIKFVYLRLPNPSKQNIIAFKNFFPDELKYLLPYVDYNLQFEKTFLNPLENIFNAINWQLEEKITFDI